MQKAKLSEHDRFARDLFRGNSELAALFITDIVDDGNPAEIEIAVNQVLSAFGGVSGVLSKAQLTPMELYRTLTVAGTPPQNDYATILIALAKSDKYRTRSTPHPSDSTYFAEIIGAGGNARSPVSAL